MQSIKEDNLLLQNTIDYLFKKCGNIELIIRPECNQKCKYCYLVQHGKELYPYRASKKEIINNVQLIVNYLITNNYCIKRMDLFAGDMFYDDLFFDIIEIIKQYYIYIYNNHYDFIKNSKPELDGFQGLAISIPCNMSFCADDKKIEKVRQICKEFLQLKIKIYFSYSTDGIYALDTREQKVINESFFDKVFAFCEEMSWGVHPMISYESIDHIIDNYEWFKKKFTQFNLNGGSYNPYYLEVRNDGWDEYSISKYKKFINYHLNDIFHNHYNSNLDSYFNNYVKEYELDEKQNYNRMPRFESLGRFVSMNDNSPSCGLGNLNLSINVGDLSFVPCHRLTYPELRGGNFIVENNEIKTIEATEFLSAYLNLVFCNNNMSPKCISCIYNSVCMKGCLGSQYEIFSEPYYPIPSVCKMLQAKYETIIEFYHSIGLFHYIFNTEPKYPVNTLFKSMLINLGYLEYSRYKNLGDFYGTNCQYS